MGLHAEVETMDLEGMSPLIFSLQALLVRHETYIADSERERKAMTAHVEMLEAEKQALEKKNATVIEENRSLLDQLEAVNSAVSESDAHVVDLQATLQSAQQELQKLSHLAARTESLERQLADLEREQATWQHSLEVKGEDEKSAVRRWQKAERTLASLQDEVERIEREAKEEKDRHHEIVERMERRHAVEKELGSAAGRLKGAAAAKTGTDDGTTPNVVSHFVKDILQDNANLQMGIVELREMLVTSNEEVENLRKQLQMHGPIEDQADEKPTAATTRREDLREELTRANSSELHVHHHYHAPPATPKVQTLRRPKKKRHGAFTPGHFTPPSRSGTPRSSFSYGSPTPTAAILQQTAASIPQSVPQRNRWSVQSNQTYHSYAEFSGPSSPQSTTNRTSSIFDRVFSDAGLDSSRPTTPDTEDPGSPVFVPAHAKRGSQSSFRTYSAPVVARGGLNSTASRPTLDSIISVEELPKLELQPSEADAIPEEVEGDWENTSSPVDGHESCVTSPLSDELTNPLHDQSFYRPNLLRRATSHESILSISGTDIHTLKSRPSQLLAPYRSSGVTSQATLADATAHAARPAAMSRPSEVSSKSLLSGMAADQRQHAATGGKPGMGKKVGGWIFGRWGAAPAPSDASNISSASKPQAKAKPARSSDAADAIARAATQSRNQDQAPSKKATQAPVSATDTVKAAPTAQPPPTSAIDVPKADLTSVGESAPKPASTVSSNPFVGSPEAHATPKKTKVRSPGINQPGPISGFFPEVRTPVREPVLNAFDERALKDILGGT